MVSTTPVYAAHPKNPNFLLEAAELRGHRDSRFVNDKLRAEKQVQRFAKEHPAVEVALLRLAPILGVALLGAGVGLRPCRRLGPSRTEEGGRGWADTRLAGYSRRS